MIRSRAINLAIAIGLGCTWPSFALAVPEGVGGLQWSDEFNGSQLDSSKWNVRLGVGRDDIYTSQAISMSNGQLKITTFTETGIHYNGWIDTLQKYQPTFGYSETRMQFNTSHGMWSAFWLQTPQWSNPQIGNPAASGTEIDVIEHRRVNGSGSDYRSRIHMAKHWDGYGADHKSDSSTQNKFLSGMGNGSWHTYGLLWEPDKYTYYFDGQVVWTHTTAISRRSEYLILSSEAQTDSWAGDIPAAGYGSLATSTTNMLVDYVRVYSLAPELPGDYNDDGVVDSADYVVWRKGFGSSQNIPNDETPGMVEAQDYVVWTTNFGRNSSGSGGAIIPEPTSSTALHLLFLLLLVWPRINDEFLRRRAAA